MYRAAVLALCLASANAFLAPVRPKAHTALASDFANEIGAQPPAGFWDPAGLCVSQEKFERYRDVELKHGRVSMLAVVGYLVPEVFRFGGEIAPGLKFADVPHGLQALDAIPSFGWIQIVFLIGAVDYWGVFGDYNVGKIGSTISQGGILDLDEEETETRLAMEITHGRLAMLAIMELLRHDAVNYLDGKDLDHFIIGLPAPY